MNRLTQLLALLMLLLAAVPTSTRAQSPVPEGAEVERIADGFQFVEGPVWYEGGLLFSDIPANIIYRWTDEEGVTAFLSPSGNSNGLAVDHQGRLLLAQHGDRQIGVLEDADVLGLATAYEGRRLNSPNDLIVLPDGSIYFTDPPWGVEPEEAELDFSGVYRVTPDGEVRLLVDSLFYPNGIALSPDERTLYVTTSHGRTVDAFDLADHELSNHRIIAEFEGEGATDGMKVDDTGRLYVTAPGGVAILDPNGTVIDQIAVPEATTNVAWGSDKQTLYITAGTGIYRIKLEP